MTFRRLLLLATLLLALAACSAPQTTDPLAESYLFHRIHPLGNSVRAEVTALPGAALGGSHSIQDGRVRILSGKKELANAAFELNGGVSGCWIGDLDGDRQPEIVIWATSAGSGSYGSLKILEWTGTTLEELAPPALNTNQKRGYRGRDRFIVKGNRLIREFPLYGAEDSNANPSGGKRRITYQHVNGAWESTAGKSPPPLPGK